MSKLHSSMVATTRGDHIPALPATPPDLTDGEPKRVVTFTTSVSRESAVDAARLKIYELYCIRSAQLVGATEPEATT